MKWWLSHRFDSDVRPLADRHYNRQTVGSPQFVPPGRCLVLKTRPVDAFWVTSWPLAEYTKHEWAGAWVCSAFRNEGSELSSRLIEDAVRATCWRWPVYPPEGFVTFVDRSKTKSKKHPGYCYRMAGWNEVGRTKQAGLVALHLSVENFPRAEAPCDATPSLLEAA